MKLKKLKTLLIFGMIICFGTAFMFGCSQSTSSDSSAEEADEEDETEADDTEDSEDSEDSEDEETEIITMTLDDDSTVDLIELETGEGSIYGEYYCSADESVWSFGGDILGIAYTDDDGSQRCYICYLTFYQTAEADEDGTYQLCIGITNILESVTSYWYAGNIVDEDEEVIGVALIDPSDDSSYISLVILDDEDEEEEEDEDDSDSE